MLDAVLEKLSAPVLDRFAGPVDGRAKLLELAAFCLGLAAAALIARHLIWIGLALFAIARFLAAVAGRAGVSDLTEFYTAVAFAALPFAFVLEAPVRALPAVFLMFGLAANAAASLKFGRGLIGSAELLALFALAALLPAWFGLIAYVGGVLCFVAAGVSASRRV
jgi:hypothetical protein